jgi:hypothetical protein
LAPTAKAKNVGVNPVIFALIATTLALQYVGYIAFFSKSEITISLGKHPSLPICYSVTFYSVGVGTQDRTIGCRLTAF